MVTSSGMLVKSESISKLLMMLLESCSTISVAKLNDCLTVYLLVVNGSKIGTKYFASLYVDVCKADKIGLKGGQPLAHFFMHFTRTIHSSRPSSYWLQMSSQLNITFLNVIGFELFSIAKHLLRNRLNNTTDPR